MTVVAQRNDSPERAELLRQCDAAAAALTPVVLDLLRQERRDARRDAFREAAALLVAMAEDAERFAAGPMARLDDLPKAQAYREAARRVKELA